MFSRFDTIPACDGQTDGRRDVQPIAKTCFSKDDARKNTCKRFFVSEAAFDFEVIALCIDAHHHQATSAVISRVSDDTLLHDTLHIHLMFTVLCAHSFNAKQNTLGYCSDSVGTRPRSVSCKPFFA